MTVSISNSLPDNSLPCGWQKKPFSDVIFDLTGGQPKVQQRDYDADGRLPVIDQGQAFIGGYTSDLEMKCQVQRPCILFGDHTRIFKWVDQPFAIGADGVKVLSTHNNLLPKFAYHFLHQARLPDDQGYSRHFKFLKRLEIPIPPLPEQRRIADILDKADAIRRKRQEAKDASDCFALSLFNYAFVNNYRHTNQQKSLVEIAEVVSGVTKGRRFNGAATRVVPYLRVANVQDGFLELSEIKTIEALTAEVPKLALQQGDVVMTEGGDFDKLGRGALWEHNVPDCIHQNHVFRVRVNRRFLLPEYFNVFLRTTRAKSYFLSCAKKTSNLASINITQLKALPVPLPKIALQEIFVRELRKSQQYKTNIKAHTDEVNNLFNSLVQRAFRGEL